MHQMQSAAKAEEDEQRFRLYTLARNGYRSAVEKLDHYKHLPDISNDYRIDLVAARLHLSRLQLMTDDEATKRQGRSQLEIANNEIKSLEQMLVANERLRALKTLAEELTETPDR